ncbi:MAG: acyl-CoA dehydrogenase family protein [Actinobacteria bacterium]|nr:acyl-CoA dehydrogenase family protein [Actinomycetota bacterium]
MILLEAPLDQIKDLARDEVFATLEDRYRSGEFSRKLWERMGEIGLLGMTVPETYGGSGGTPAGLAEAVSEFTRLGCDLGLALSWITHLSLCMKSIEYFGTREQKERYLPLLASGRWVGATAVSEPGSGAHPAGIETRADESDSGYTLNGMKIFVTDGPVADLIIVLAASGEAGKGKKELTAYLVETDTPGCEARSMELNFLKTSPHGELSLSGVNVDAGSVLAERGDGHNLISKGAFARERSLVTVAVSGLCSAASKRLADSYRQKYDSYDFSGTEASSWMHHLSAVEVYRRVSTELVEESFLDYERWKRSLGLLIYLGLSYAKWAAWIEELTADKKLDISFPMDIILNDMKLVLVGGGLLLKEGKKLYM